MWGGLIVVLILVDTVKSGGVDSVGDDGDVETFHAGQIAMTRRIFGKAPLR